MSKKDYVPSKISEKDEWAGTLKPRIATDGPTIGLSAGDITAVQDACDDITEGVQEIEDAITIKEAAVGTANTKIGAAEKIIRTHIKRAKTHSAYTVNIGQHLGVEGDENSIDIPTSKPALKLTKEVTGWKIDFNLKDFFHGVKIYRKQPEDADFVYLATDTSSPYIDNTPLLKGATYRASYILNDREVGQIGDAIATP